MWQFLKWHLLWGLVPIFRVECYFYPLPLWKCRWRFLTHHPWVGRRGQSYECWLPVIKIRRCFHFIKHALDFGVISIWPFYPILSFSASPWNHVIHESLETCRCKCQSVKWFVILNPEWNVPGFIIFPTVHKISVWYSYNITVHWHEWGLCVPLYELDSGCPILNRGCLLRNDFIPKGIVFRGLRDWIL